MKRNFKKYNVNFKGKRNSLYFTQQEFYFFLEVFKIKNTYEKDNKETDKEVLKVINGLIEKEKIINENLTHFIKDQIFEIATTKLCKLNMIETPSLFEK